LNTELLIQLALEKLKCQQKDLAKRLKVSPTQITKWKNAESMSSDMEAKLREMIGLGDRYPAVVVWAGSIDAADKWDELIDRLADSAADNAETGYDTYPLTDENKDMPHSLCWHTLYTLREMGVEIPTAFPPELDFVDREASASEEDEWETSDEQWEILMKNPYSALIYRIYGALNDVWGFHEAYIKEHGNDDDDYDDLDLKMEIEACLLELAAAKLDPEPVQDLAPKFREFKYKTKSQYVKWLRKVQDKAFRDGVPLRAELMDLVNKSTDELNVDAERESLGLNEGRLHPDIYMNELLTGMRTIHQVLPAIIKKLGIGPDEFQLDTSELHK
jgi:transcriptional regulator with XRE-family HTH domain